MEAKKNPEIDQDKRSGQFFLIGLSASLILTIIAFEWTSRVVKPKERPHLIDEAIAMVDVPVTKIKSPTPEPPTIAKREFIPTVEIVPVASSTAVDPTHDFLQDTIDPLQETSYTSEDETECGEDEIFLPVEQVPVPIGGFEALYKLLATNIKYPKIAIRQEIEGKVFVEFVVGKTGHPVDLKISKGVSKECDAEAMRVIALSRWEPGKQRGKPVRVRMVLPVTFRLK